MRTALILLVCSTAFAQEFEVASIKIPGPAPNSPIGLLGLRRTGGPGTDDPAHINWPRTSLFQIIQAAYDVKDYQIEGPDWLQSAQYDFAVGVPEGATKEQVAIMWRNLLSSRFDLTLHKIQKEFPVNELVIVPRGHKLQENTEPGPEPDTPAAPPRLGPDGKIKLSAPGMITMSRNGPNGVVVEATGRAQPVSALITLLESQVEHPVVDKTGLTGLYDFSIEYTPNPWLGGPPRFGPPSAGATANAGPAAAPDLGLDLAAAIQQQLGLRLVKGKAMLDVLVIDKAEKVPTEN